MELAVFTGLRQGDLGSTGTVDRSRRVLLIVETKNGKDREVPRTNGRTRLARRGLGTHGSCSDRTASTATGPLGPPSEAKLTGIRFHDSGTFASWAVQREPACPR
jgi:integrase